MDNCTGTMKRNRDGVGFRRAVDHPSRCIVFQRFHSKEHTESCLVGDANDAWQQRLQNVITSIGSSLGVRLQESVLA